MSSTVDYQARVRQITDDVLRRRQEGESLSDEAILTAHPELADKLAVALKRQRFIAIAPRRGRADESRDGDGHNPLPAMCAADRRAGRDQFASDSLPRVRQLSPAWLRE